MQHGSNKEYAWDAEKCRRAEALIGKLNFRLREADAVVERAVEVVGNLAGNLFMPPEYRRQLDALAGRLAVLDLDGETIDGVVLRRTNGAFDEEGVAE